MGEQLLQFCIWEGKIYGRIKIICIRNDNSLMRKKRIRMIFG